MTFTIVRPYPNQVTEIVVGTGLVPITNVACGFLATAADAKTIFPLIIAAAKAAQGTNTLGIPNPEPALTMTSGLPENSLRDLILGETQICYNSPDAPQAYVVRGTVIIPNQEAPNGPPLQTLSIDQYIGQLVITAPPEAAKLVMNPATGELKWTA